MRSLQGACMVPGYIAPAFLVLSQGVMRIGIPHLRSDDRYFEVGALPLLFNRISKVALIGFFV